MRALAHKLKGSGETFGFDVLSALGARLEQSSESAKWFGRSTVRRAGFRYDGVMPVNPATIRKLAALTNRLDEAIGERTRSTGHKWFLSVFDPEDALPWFERWNAISEDLRAGDPEFADIPNRGTPAVTPSTNHENRGA